MGTRGIVGFIVGEQEKIAYNHFDSYPAVLGVRTLAFLREFPGPIDELRRQAEMVKVVTDATPPTQKQVEELQQFSDMEVGEYMDFDTKSRTRVLPPPTKPVPWYNLLRQTQGDWAAILQAGYMEDGSDFAIDSLFCEWGYLINLDDETLEVYQGFQKELPTAGHWAGRPTAEEAAQTYKEHLAYCKANGREPFLHPVPDYKAIELIATYPTADLPSDEEMLALDPDAT